MANSCCILPNQVRNWNDWSRAVPKDPQTIIYNAYIGSTQGVFQNADDFLATTWAASSPLGVVSNPVLVALGTDNLQNVAEAAQWNFLNITGNLAASNAIPLRKVFFARRGSQFQLNIPMTSSATTIVDMVLSFRFNLGTSGNVGATAPTVPVIAWRGYNNSGPFTLSLTFNNTVHGKQSLVVWTKDNGGNYAVFELELYVFGPSITVQQNLQAVANVRALANAKKMVKVS